MGDGGVACMPLQRVMERVSVPEPLCGGKSNGNSNASSNGFSTSKLVKKKIKRKVKVMVKVKKVEAEKRELGLEKGGKSCSEVENGEIVDKGQKEEVEEGELGSLKWPRSEAENGEFVSEKGEIVSHKWRKSEVEKGEVVPGKWRKGEADKEDSGSWRNSKNEIEKGEFVPDRWQKEEAAQEEYSCSKPRRFESGKGKIWKLDHERTPPSGKYPIDDTSRRKEFNRSGSQLNRSFPRWENGQDRNLRLCSKVVDDEGSYKNNEYSNGKNYGREYFSGNRLKRHGTDVDSIERKHYGDYSDYAGSKSRRLSDDCNRVARPEHYSRHSTERSYRNPSLNRISSADKYSSRHYDSSISSRVVYDRHGRSPGPGHSERSPHDRVRHYDHRDQSPVRRAKSPYAREKSPHGRERSPYEWSRNHDRRNRSPIHVDRSPQDRARNHDRKDQTLNYLEGSPLDRSRHNTYREASRKSGGSEKHSSQHGTKEEKLYQSDPNGKDPHFSGKESPDKSNMNNVNGLVENNLSSPSGNEEQSQIPCANCPEQVDEALPVELPSMEEDMDICNTPPHVPVVADSVIGKWFYLDYFGMECGPSKLTDLKVLVEEQVLASDHLVKHLDSDRWVTVENAVSPLVTVNFTPIVSETVTQLVSPPEAPGNLLADSGDSGQSCIHTGEETSGYLPHSISSSESAVVSGLLEDLHIDERVGVLLEGFTFVPGRELEILGEVLQVNFYNTQWEIWGDFEGISWHRALTEEHYDKKTDEGARDSDITCKEAEEPRLSVPLDNAFPSGDFGDWFAGRWSCKGGDWKRNDEAAQDRFLQKKLVVNDGFPLCQMPKSGHEDPRWNQKDELYYPSRSRRLDLPSWAFSCPDERSDCNGVIKGAQIKPIVVREVKGTMLPVVRINACVVKDHGSFVSEPRVKVRAKERPSSRSARAHSSSSDHKRSSAVRDSRSKTDMRRSWKSITAINTPKDRICTVDDLQLHLGEWYYHDGAGRERGPSSFSELQILVDQGVIQKFSSVFRKFDKVWVPITSAAESSEASAMKNSENKEKLIDVSGTPDTQFQVATSSERNAINSSFHSLHPQFIGFTCGKLHELVMKSFKSREFAAAINEVLDPWINAKQPKKEADKHVYWKSEGDARAGKRARWLVDESESDYEMEEDLHRVQNEDSKFEELCGDATFSSKESGCSSGESGSWGLLDGRMLARVFHFLRCDMRSLVFASLTCKRWRAAVRFYKDISRQVDLSFVGSNCNDSMIWNIMNGYDKERINSLVLIGCTNITAGTLEEILCSFPHLSSIDIRGCSQFGELANKLPTVTWIQSQSSRGVRTIEESHSKMRTLKQTTELTSTSKTKSHGTDNDDYGELKDYFDSVDRRDSANQLFRRSLYKRSKLFDARKSSSILSRDARMRRWTIKKSENGYKRMEKFIVSSLKDIMRENTFEFFVPKVADIEEKMKNGYYVRNGLNSVKDDICRMCRNAIKAKSRNDTKNMNHIITLFIQLATRLEGGSKSSRERDEMMKSWKNDSYAASKYRKNPSKVANGRKYMNRNNGGSDYGEYTSDREIRRRLSNLNKRFMDSESDTSDDMDPSSEDGKSDSESNASDTDSALDLQSETRTGESRGGGYFSADEVFDSVADDREWGARMTKASLVPPVTRKYEVIDKYVIVADEEDVQRKMRVTLPDDYSEKVLAQKNGTEESDMELPEVKDFKPRKQLGDEVIEQEVYGIDPYTHNLLLDSMPEELEWSQLDKQVFIEDVLLCSLNKQVRHFTGSGNTPMIYPLRPVIEEIKRSIGEGGDARTLVMCERLLKAIDDRPDDNYVAYRKGLGVVCNKEGGFGKDDFVVEFLGEVYPAWKWYEKQDGIRLLQKNSKEPAPEFYNIYLERPKGDADGYDLVVVDAMHKANYASRICHSCRPNCEAKVTAVDGHYQIGIYSVRKISHGEEITFDYNSVTESKEEYEASVCLCGSQVCRGSYLNLTGEGAFQKVLKEWHGILDRHQLMLEACELNSVSEEDVIDLRRAGLGTCLLGGLPQWLIAYSARVVRFINFERTKLPEEILKHNLEEKRKFFSEISIDVEKSDAEVQAEGVYNQRLQNLALTLDKVRYVMRRVFGDPKKAPPPVEKLRPEEVSALLWKGEGSLVEELLQCVAPYMQEDQLNDLKAKIQAHDPSGSDNIRRGLKKSLLWLRDEVRNLPCTNKCRNDAAADLIHMYAYTKYFFRMRAYEAVTSPPVIISSLDLGPKTAEKLGSGFQEYNKAYGENYCLGQLIFWHDQTSAEPDRSLARASRGCLFLPVIGSFYANLQKPSWQRVYSPKTLRFMLARMEKQPQRPWPRDRIWSFKSSPKVFGSPMLDAVLNHSSLDREMTHWLKNRLSVYHDTWDR